MFAAYLQDLESGLYIVRERYFDWQLGRWGSLVPLVPMSYDWSRPFQLDATERLGVNRYQYAASQPTVRRPATVLAFNDKDSLVLGDELRTIEPANPPRVPDPKPFPGKIKFSPSCGSGCLWVKTEESGHKWVCGASGEQAIDGVYGVCAGGGVLKITDGCTVTINCVNVGGALPPALILGSALQVSCINAIARCVYGVRGGCQQDLWPLTGPVPPPPGPPLGLPKPRPRKYIVLDVRFFI